MIVETQAPNRIDLSGGTLDIYPLYVFEEQACTINAAITLYSKVTIETRQDGQFNFHSQDMNSTLELNHLKDIPREAPMAFVASVVKFYNPQIGLNVTTSNQAPKGSGLGASSALLIALSTALNHVNRSFLNGETLIQNAADIEAKSLGIPTGKQDYFPPLYGGINALHFGINRVEREPLTLSPQFINRLSQSLIISFTGESHFSGTSNWNMLKAYIENQGQTRHNLGQIKQTALDMKQALLNEDFEHFVKLISREWENRKVLAEGVTTPKIEQLISGASRSGALASKICGAGGGGCMITLCSLENRSKVVESLQANGATIIDATICLDGIKINTSV